jgi:hydrogenase-1 operon protein HyaF
VKDKPFPIPVVSVGAGSQEEGEEQLSYIDMPKEMNTFSMPTFPEPEDVRDAPEARAAIRWLAGATRDWRPGAPNPSFDLAVLAAHDLEVVDQILGEGEVSIFVSGEPETRIQESVFPGVWRLRRAAAGNHSPETDRIEVGPVPAIALDAARAGSRAEVPVIEAPADAVGARPIIEEITHQTATRSADDPAHVINLSLLPMSPQDAEHLGAVLAAGPVRILSRGYGNCRITSTVVRDTWWVQYVNGYGITMVDSIEVTDVPEVAVASAEDIAESASRLQEALEWLERG